MWEVVYPTSRAVELAEDDEDEIKAFDKRVSPPIIRLSTNHARKQVESCKLLVLAFGRIATAFVEAYLMTSDYEIVGLVAGGKKEKDENSVLQKDPADKTCFVYSKTSKECSDVWFCQSKIEYPDGYCHDWAKEVFSKIKAEKVMILCSISPSLCIFDDEEDEARRDCVFSLKTNTWSSNVVFPYLNAPNIISGQPAAVMTHCQVFGIPAVMYLTLSENDDIDSTNLELFAPLLKHEPLQHITKRPQEERLMFIKSLRTISPHLDSNLYI